MLKPTRHHSVTSTTDVKAAAPPDCQGTEGSPANRSILSRTPLFWSKISTPMSAVATPEMAIGRMRIDRNTARPGSTELSSTATPRPRAIDAGVTIAVKRNVLPTDRQKTGSPTSLA